MLIKNEVLCQTVYNKMAAYPITDELKYLKKSHVQESCIL